MLPGFAAQRGNTVRQKQAIEPIARSVALEEFPFNVIPKVVLHTTTTRSVQSHFNTAIQLPGGKNY